MVILGRGQSAEIAARAFASWLEQRKQVGVVRALDLACGGAPTTLATLFARFSSVPFDYTGIDIHPDQVAAARAFTDFPANIAAVRLVQGNARVPRDRGNAAARPSLFMVPAPL